MTVEAENLQTVTFQHEIAMRVEVRATVVLASDPEKPPHHLSLHARWQGCGWDVFDSLPIEARRSLEDAAIAQAILDQREHR